MGKTINQHKKLKVDILTPIRFGGPQKWGDDLARALKEEGIEARNIHNFWGIIKRFFWTDADIIYSTLPLVFNLSRKPIILVIKGDYKKEKNIWNYMWPLAIKLNKLQIVHTHFFKKYLNLNNAKIISNGVFANDYHATLFNKDRLEIVTVTGFAFWDKARGVLELLKILEEIKKKTKQKFIFTVVGGGPYLKRIKEESKKYDVPVKFVGFHPNPKEVLQKSDIFVYYSFQDTFGIVLLEAMACGLPIITNNFGPTNEIISNKKEGFICNTQKEFYLAFKKLIEKAGLKYKMSYLGRKKILNVYNWSKLVQEYIRLFKK